MMNNNFWFNYCTSWVRFSHTLASFKIISLVVVIADSRFFILGSKHTGENSVISAIEMYQ